MIHFLYNEIIDIPEHLIDGPVVERYYTRNEKTSGGAFFGYKVLGFFKVPMS